MWNTASGEEIRRFEGHDGIINCLRFAADGKHILSGGRDKTARLWDATTGKEVCLCEGHTDRICGVGFFPDGSHLLTASNDKSVRIWDATTGKETKCAVKRFGPDESFFMVNSRTGNAGTRSKVPWHVVFSPNGQTALATSYNFATLMVWDIDTGKQIGRLEGTTENPHVIGFLPGGQQLRTGKRVWDLTTGDQIGGVAWDADEGSDIASSPDGRYILTSHKDKTLRLWDMNAGKEIRRIKKDLPDMQYAALTPGGKQLLVAGKTSISLFDTSTAEKIRQFQGPMDKDRLDIECLAISPDGHLAVTGGKDNTVRLWDLVTGKEIQSFQGHSGQITSVIFSPDNGQILSGSGDNTARLWDIASGKEVERLKGHTNFVSRLAFSPDGSQILTGSKDDTARLWQRATGKQIHVLKGHLSNITSVCFSPDARRLLTASGDRTVVVWDAKEGKELCQLLSFKNGNWAVVDPDGRYDASNGGEVDGLHWVVGNEPIDLAQLKNRYYEPGLLAKIMGFNKESLRDVKAFTSPKLYPQVELTAPTSEHPTLLIRLTDRGGGIGPVMVKINGKEVTADARGPSARSDANKLELHVDLGNDWRLKAGEQNVIEVSAYNSEGYLRSRGQRVLYTPPGQQTQNPTHMWAIIVGISKYENSALKLHYAAKDAEDFAKALRIAGGQFFGPDHVHIALLTTNADAEMLPTRANLAREFEAVTEKANPGDILVVYLAGHGVNHGGPEGDFYYLTCEASTAELTDPEIRRKTAISSDELTEWIKKIRTTDKQVIILDTCAAGKLAEKFAEKRDVPSSQIRALNRVKDRTGMHVLAGCAADAVSYETSRYGQGLLTYSLLFGMQGAALRENQYVDVLQLFGFAQEQVPQLAQGIGGVQRPEIVSPGGASFDIGELTTVEDKAQIPLQTLRTVVLRTSFQNKDGYRDALGLTKGVDEELRNASARGGHHPLAFVDAEEYPDSCQLFGQYHVEGKKVTVDVNLFKGGTKVANFSITGDTSALDVTIKQIVGEMQQKLDSLEISETQHSK